MKEQVASQEKFITVAFSFTAFFLKLLGLARLF